MINVFQVGVHIGMSTNATQVLQTLIAQLTGVHVAAGHLQNSLASVRKIALGAGAAFAGWEALKGIWHVIEDSRELNKELEKTKQLGGDFAKNLDATRDAAIKAQIAVPTSTLSGNVKLAREVGTTIGKPEAAMDMVGEASMTAHVISHYTGEKEEDITANLMRIADARAQIYKTGPDGKEHVDPAKLTAELEAAAKGLILGANFINSQALLQKTRQGSAAEKAQSPEVAFADGVELAIAVGAAKTGTAETGLVQEFVAGKMTKDIAEHLTDAGLLKPDEWHSGNSGGVVIEPKAAQRFKGTMSDPVAWLTTGEGGAAIKQYAAKNGIDTMMAIFQLFGRQTVQRLVSEIVSNEPQFARAREIYGQIPSVKEQYAEQQKNDLDTNIQSVAASWKSFKEAFSDAATPAVIPILHGLTDAIQFFMKAVAEHPKVAGALIDLAGGISAMTALSGAWFLVAGAWSPLVNGLKLLTGIGNIAATGTAIGGVGTAFTALGLALAPFAAGAAAYEAFMHLPPLLKSLADWVLGDDARGTARGGGRGHSSSVAPGTAPHHDDDDVTMPAPGASRGGGRGSTHSASPYVAPPAAASGEKQSLILNVDGKRLASIMLDYGANSLSQPPTGRMGADVRVSPLMPGLSSAFG